MNSRPHYSAIEANPKSFFHSEGQTIGRANSSGWAIGGLCPFHDDSRIGNFRVNLETGSFKCFACGTKGGDLISFLRQKYNLSFVEACRRLSDGNY